MLSLFKSVYRFVLLLGALVFFLPMLGCGRKMPTQPECYAFIAETLFVEPGHRIGAFVIERRCGDFRLHTKWK